MRDCGCDEGFSPQPDGSMAVCLQHYVPQSAKLRTSRPTAPDPADTETSKVGLSPLFTWRSAIADSDLDPTSRFVAVMLSLHMNERGGSAFPSYTTLAGETHLTRSAVIRAVGRLTQRGWLVRKTHGPGRGRTNTYTAYVPPAAPSAEKVRREPDKRSEKVRKGVPGTPRPSAPILTEDVNNSRNEAEKVRQIEKVYDEDLFREEEP